MTRKGLTEVGFLLSYSTFLFFVIYVSGLYGMSIFENAPNPSIDRPTLEAPDTNQIPILSQILTFLAPFGYFTKMLTVDSNYTIVFTLLLAPPLVVIAYIIIKMIPFT